MKVRRSALFGVVLSVALAGLAPGWLGAASAAPSARPGNVGDEGGSLGPGCAPDRPAVAHYAGGVLATEPHGPAPIPCVTPTGFRTSEIAVAIARSGTLLFEPALETETTGLPIGLLRSNDLGASWSFINPSPPALPRLTAHDTTMVVDRHTGRVFWNASNGAPYGIATPHVDYSDNNGETWSSSSTLPVLFDDGHVFTGPPTRHLKHLMRGYPDVVYVAVAGGFTCSTHGFCGTHVTKSLDGGKTFGPSVALPAPPECPGQLTNGGYLSYGVVSSDGTVYLPFTPCQEPYVAISHDEGATWQLVHVADTETIGFGALSLGMDKQGNLYIAWTAEADRLPYLSISRDGGLHWSAPLMIAAPGVNETAEPQLVSGARGQVAVSYYGSTNSPGVPFPTPCSGPSLSCPGYEQETWSTYITESFNALDRQRLFWSATLNDPADPTWYGATPSEIGVLGQPGLSGGAFAGGTATGQFASIGGPSLFGRFDYFGATMAPDDTPWVGFDQECPFGLPVAGNPNCPSTLSGTAPDGVWGMVGRLVSARPENAQHSHRRQ
jgi:hypothetical protein